MNPPVIYVVDDEASIRQALGHLFKAVGWNVQTFASARDFLAFPRPPSPGCLVLDLVMPEMDGLELQRQLVAAHCNLPIIILTGQGNISLSVQAMKNGALDFIEKPIQPQHLLDVVRRAIDYHRKIQHQDTLRIELQACFDQLTPQEREVFSRVVAGLLNKQIADELGITEKTVKVHRARLMHKMGAQSAADLVRFTDYLGLFPSPPKTHPRPSA